MKMRSHDCGQLRASDEGARVRLCGWVDSVRDHGGLIFLDLRDRHGITQCVFDPQDSQSAWDAAQACRSEYVVTVQGVVRARLQFEARDAGDGGDRLPAEAEGVDLPDVAFGADLAGGMRFEAQQGVIGIHAVAVIHDRDHIGARSPVCSAP